MPKKFQYFFVFINIDYHCHEIQLTVFFLLAINLVYIRELKLPYPSSSNWQSVAANHGMCETSLCLTGNHANRSSHLTSFVFFNFFILLKK